MIAMMQLPLYFLHVEIDKQIVMVVLSSMTKEISISPLLTLYFYNSISIWGICSVRSEIPTLAAVLIYIVIML